MNPMSPVITFYGPYDGHYGDQLYQVFNFP